MKNLFSEACLILPLPREDAASHVLKEWAGHVDKAEARILEAFGGFTRTEGTGAWRDHAGRTVHDRVGIYTIACPAFAPAFDASGVVSHESERAWLGAVTTLKGIARDYAKGTDQQCVYLRCPTGEVLFVTPTGRLYNPDAVGPSYMHAAEYWARRAHRGT